MTALKPTLAAAFAALLAFSACGGGEDEGAGGPGRPGESSPSVVGGVVEEARFASEIEAVGTAYANEQTVLTAPVTERIERLYFDDGARVSQARSSRSYRAARNPPTWPP